MASAVSSYRGLYKRDILEAGEAILSKTTMDQNVTSIVLEYLNDDLPMGRAIWIEYGGVDPGPVPEMPQKLYNDWCGLDPHDKTKRAYETHITAVYRPESFTNIVTGKKMPATLETLQRLGVYFFPDPAFHQNEKVEGGPGCWLMMRKGVFQRWAHPRDQQESIKKLNTTSGIGYEEEPSLIDLAFLIFARNVYKGERHLGDRTGEERQPTMSLCKETYKVQGFDSYLQMGCFFSPGCGMFVNGVYMENSYCFGRRSDGIAALLKYPDQT